MSFEIVGVRAENIRGYWSTRLPLDRSVSVVVGPNNSGKTSVFKLLNWILNEVNPDTLESAWDLPTTASNFVLPARDTKHRARRLTIEIAVDDGRMHRKYKCIDGIAHLRFNIRLSPSPTAYLALGEAKKGELRTSDPMAVELFRRVKASTRYVYVPSFRDVASNRFNQTLRSAFLEKLGPRVLHHRQGGAPAEYRNVKQALDSLVNTLQTIVSPLWPSMQANLPAGISRDGQISIDCGVDELVNFLCDKLSLRISTGDHDASFVPLGELGSGLQSLLDLAVSRAAPRGKPTHQNTFLVVEEPESFLHPSAQRVVTRSLLTQGSEKLVITTHSSVVVDESEYGQVVICKDHSFYFPKDVDAARQSINSAFLSGLGAEMLFSKSVMFVEGESDRLFFEWIRRRLSALDNSGRMDQLFVVSVGGKKAFSPWIQILESYGTPSDRPIAWLVVADGDAATDVRRAFLDARIPIAQAVVERLADVATSVAQGLATWSGAIRTLNNEAAGFEVRLALMPVDLEHAALANASAPMLRKVRDQIGSDDASLQGILNKLGSKAYAPVREPVKAPWVRGFIGKELPAAQIGEDTRGVLARWMAPLFSAIEIEALFAGL